MKKIILIAILVIGLMSCHESGRYQGVVKQGLAGEGSIYEPVLYIVDTKTGDVYSRSYDYENQRHTQRTWKPVKKEFEYDTLKKIIY